MNQVPWVTNTRDFFSTVREKLFTSLVHSTGLRTSDVLQFDSDSIRLIFDESNNMTGIQVVMRGKDGVREIHVNNSKLAVMLEEHSKSLLISLREGRVQLKKQPEE